MESKFNSAFTQLKSDLKKRGQKGYSKSDFQEDLINRVNDEELNNILKERTPKEFFINEAMTKDNRLKEKFFEIIHEQEK